MNEQERMLRAIAGERLHQAFRLKWASESYYRCEHCLHMVPENQVCPCEKAQAGKGKLHDEGAGL